MQSLSSKAITSANALVETAVAALHARDFATAREALRQAVTIGHVDGALMEIALVANGSGAAPDWPHAKALLDLAEPRDPVAARHQALLKAMDLDAQGKPTRTYAPVQLSSAPNVMLFRNFLTSEECAHVAQVASDLMEPSRVIDPTTGVAIAHPVRRCDNAVIGPTREDLVIRALNLRIATATRTRVDQGEPLTVLRYQPGHEFKPHYDGLPGTKNQRIKTMLIYLNQGFEGGETEFVTCDLIVRPRAGDAILFDNVDATGAIDLQSRHAGLPVTRGTKWLATRWIRAAPYDPWNA